MLAQIFLAIQLASCIEQNELYIPDIQETDSIASANSLCTLIEKYYQSGRSIHRFDPDAELVGDTYVHLTATQSNDVRKMLSQLNLCDEHIPAIVKGTDGASWTFEQIADGHYCMQNFHSSSYGEEFEAYREFALYLLKACRVKTWELDVY